MEKGWHPFPLQGRAPGTQWREQGSCKNNEKELCPTPEFLLGMALTCRPATEWSLCKMATQSLELGLSSLLPRSLPSPREGA